MDNTVRPRPKERNGSGKSVCLGRSVVFVFVQGMGARAWCMLGKCSTPELHSQPRGSVLIVISWREATAGFLFTAANPERTHEKYAFKISKPTASRLFSVTCLEKCQEVGWSQRRP